MRFGGDPNADKTEPGVAQADTSSGNPAFAYLESASTNSGENCALSAQTLRKLGHHVEVANVAIVQHPQAHKRACLTWERQFGRPPMGWCPRATEANLGVSNAEMLLCATRHSNDAIDSQNAQLSAPAVMPWSRYALGEFRRIEAYSDRSKAFLVMPPDFPNEFIAPLSALEPLLRDTIKKGLREPGAPTSYAASVGVTLSRS